jgi:peptide/nickel transport system substrate-binding protein
MLRVAVRELPRSHDPAIGKLLDGIWLDTLACDAPFRWNADGDILPALALSWSYRAFDRIVDLVIRPDAFFADGSPVTAEDVRWSLERVRTGSEIPDAWRLEHVRRIEAVGPATVRLVLNEPDASLMSSLACSALSVLPEGAHPLLEAGGSGPFVLDTRTSEMLTFQRQPMFWQVGRPRIDTLRISAIADDTTRSTALVTGNVDLIPNVPLLDVPTLQQDALVSLVGGPSNRLCLLQLNLASPRLQLPAVRHLLATAIDRDLLVQVATAGQAEASGLLFPEDAWARGDAGELETGNPDDIRAELAALGIGSELSLRLITNDSDATLANTAVVLQDQLAYAGIALGVDLLDENELEGEVAAGEFDLLASYTPPWRDPHELVRPLLASDGVLNRSGYASPRADGLIRGATLATDQEQRADRYHRLQERVLEDMPVIVLFRPHYYDAMIRRLTNYERYPPVTSRGLASAVLEPAES